jgi:hypothetical protein
LLLDQRLIKDKILIGDAVVPPPLGGIAFLANMRGGYRVGIFQAVLTAPSGINLSMSDLSMD